MNSTQTEPSRLPAYIATMVYYLSFIILGLSTAAGGPSLLKLAKHTSSQIDRISLIFVFGALGYLIGSFFGGRAYDRLPGHRLMALTLLFLALASLIIPISRSLEVLLFAMFLSGFASGILDVGANTLLLWTHGKKAGPFLNGLHFFFGVGSLIAPLLLARVLLITGDIHWLYWALAIVCIPVAILLWFLQEPNHEYGDSEKGSGTVFPVVPVLVMTVLFFLYVGLELGFGNWIYAYALTLHLETVITSAYLTSAFWGAFTFGRLLGVWISTRLRSKTILFIDIIGCAVSIAVIMLWKDSRAALWVGTIGLGLSMASIFPTFLMLAGERMYMTGAITGWFLVGSGAGSMLLPWLIGQVFVFTGPRAMATVLLVDLLILIVVFLLFIRMRPVPLPDRSTE
jgi:FHS family Na+ dependent glucose MFS transporter 1